MTEKPEKMQTDAAEWQATCPNHGPYTARGVKINGKRMGGSCPACSEAREAQRKAEDEARRRAERRRKVAKLFGESGIPPRFRGRTFDNFRVEPGKQGQASAVKLCKAYANRFDDMMAAGACVIMVGNPGTGKTHLAAAIAQVVIPTGRSVHFTTVGRLLRHIKSTYSRNASETEDQALRSYLAPDLLILDEVGVQRGTESERFILTEAMGIRYEYMKPMIVMGNCTQEELAAYLGDRLVSRLQEGGGPFIVCNWSDYRPRVHEDQELPRRDVPEVKWSSA